MESGEETSWCGFIIGLLGVIPFLTLQLDSQYRVVRGVVLDQLRREG